LVTRTGPPGPPKGRVRVRKPEVIKSLEQLEEIFQANVATYDIASDDEVEQASASIVASYRILKSQLESREPVNDESHLKAPTITYPRSQQEDRFFEGLESALGPGSHLNIPKKYPKVSDLLTSISASFMTSAADFAIARKSSRICIYQFGIR
jgi:hypothetical protein